MACFFANTRAAGATRNLPGFGFFADRASDTGRPTGTVAAAAAAAVQNPGCSYVPSETNPGSRITGFTITPTHLRIYTTPGGTCRVMSIQVGYLELANHLDSAFLDHLSTTQTAGVVG